jgi:hypothetical protein
LSFVKAILLLLKLASALIDYLERRRHIEEGERRALAQVSEEIDEKIKKSSVSRDSVDDSGLRNDANNRDNWSG